MFTIFEVLFLLAIDDEEGDLLESAVEDLEPALAGAVLAELVLYGRLRLQDGRVSVMDPAPTEHPILDHTLFEILDTSRMRKVKYWINTLTYEKLRDEIGQQLVENGALIRLKKRLMLVAPFRDELNGQPVSGQASAKFVLKNRLREIVLAGSPANTTEWIQFALLYHCDLLTLVFTRGERKAAARKIQKILDARETDAVLDEALQQIIAVATRSIN